MMVFAPLASAIPLAALAGVLAIFAWNMIEKEVFWMPLRASSGDPVVLLSTFFLVIFRDVTEGILVGFALGAVLFIRRMSEVAQVEARAPLVSEDRADEVAECDSAAAIGDDVVVYRVVVYRIRGAFFFGAASTVGVVPDRIADHPRVFSTISARCRSSTAARRIRWTFWRISWRGGAGGCGADIRRTLLAVGLREPRAHHADYIDDAIAAAHRDLEGASAAAVA